MRRAAIYLLVVLLWSCVGSMGQEAPVKGFQYPRIVARFHRYNQTQTLNPVTLYTPKHWGVFRISVVLVLAVSGGNGVWQANVESVNRHGTFNEPLSALLQSQNAAGSIAEDIIAIEDDASKSLKFSVAPSYGDPTGSKYSVTVVVEQLE